MDRKDLSQIKLGGLGFTSKWWKEKRPEVTKGSGVVRALDDWAAACGKAPEACADDRAAEAARKAATALIAAMTKAKAKCAKEGKEALEACALYLKLAGDYRDNIAVAPGADAPDEKTWPRIAAEMTKSLAEAKAAAAAAAKHLAAVATANKAVAQVTALANARTQGKAGKPVEVLTAQLDKVEKALIPAGKFLAAQARPLEAHRKRMVAAQRLRAHAAEVDRHVAEFDSLMEFERRLDLALDDTRRELEEARSILKASDRTLDSVRSAFADFTDKVYDHMQVSLQDMPAELGEVVQRSVAVLRKKDQEMTSAERNAMLDEIAAIRDRLTRIQRIAAGHLKAATAMKRLIRGFEKEPDFAAAIPKLDKDIATMGSALKTAAKAVDGVEKMAEKIQPA
jgi:hypothetical protein